MIIFLRFILLVILVLIFSIFLYIAHCLEAFAGVDFASISQPSYNVNVPIFHTRIEAEQWAQKYFWFPGVEKTLMDKRISTRAQWQRKGALEEWELYGVALKMVITMRKFTPGAVWVSYSVPEI